MLNVIVVPFLVHPSLVGPAANTGITITGSGANVIVSGGVIGVCTTGVHVTNNAAFHRAAPGGTAATAGAPASR